MKITFLAAKVPLTKTFTLEDGQLKKTGHPRIIDVTSFQHDVDTIEDLHLYLLAHAEEGHCFLKGNVTRQLVDESRAGSTDMNEPTRVLLLDLDGLKDVRDVEEFLRQLRLDNVDYIVQYSSSMGIIPERGISAHVFVLLDKPWYPSMLKQWLIHMNLTNHALRQNIGMTRTNNALRWALDVSTCQNDKLIYIAPPLVGEGVVDSWRGDRIQLVKKAQRCAALEQLGPIPSAESNRVAMDKLLNDLRDKAGLPKKPKVVFRSAGPVQYMANPDQAVVTGIKEERGFVYLNLNGGDSYAYYHPKGNPEFIHNFKGEPVYKTSELAPEYWAQVKDTVNEPRYTEKGEMYLAFRDFQTATYWNGIWDKKAQNLTIAQAKSADQLRHFLKQYGQPMGEFVPDWTVTFDPHGEVIVDPDRRLVNLFQPTSYMRLPHKDVREVPPATKRIIAHALGNDDEVFERFMNWLAVIMQYKQRTGTAWVLHGIQGTGKGLMLDKVLRPLFGLDYVVSKRMEELESQFNGYMERCFILFLDEAQISASNRESIIDSNLKNYIVEPRISIRRMHAMPYEVNNYLNLIFASNKLDPVIVPPEDRRFNVAVFQDKQIVTSDAELAQVANELENFYHYLMTREASKELARQPLNNPAKQKMVHIGMSAIDVAARALLTGDLAFFWDQRPQVQYTGNTTQDVLAARYMRYLGEFGRGQNSVSREELQDLLAYIVGNIPMTPYKFTSLIKHHGLIVGPVWREGKTIRGLKVDWVIDNDLRKEMGIETVDDGKAGSDVRPESSGSGDTGV